MSDLLLKTYVVCLGAMIADAIIELLERSRAPRSKHVAVAPLSKVIARVVFKAVLASVIFFVLGLACGWAI